MVSETEVLNSVKYTKELPRQTYYTPDGREIKALPCVHTTTQGTLRDANLDKGWLIQKPAVLKPYCPHCDKWHDTQAEIEACGERKRATMERYSRIARNQQANDLKDKDVKISNLEKKVDELSALLQKVLNGRS